MTVIEHGKNDGCEERDENERDDDLLRPLLLMPRAGLHAPLEERLVVDREIDRKARRCRSEYRQKYPTLPVIPRARGPEDEGNEADQPQHALHHRLPIQRIHADSVRENSEE